MLRTKVAGYVSLSDINSEPPSILIFSGYPRFTTILSSIRMTRFAEIFRPIIDGQYLMVKITHYVEGPKTSTTCQQIRIAHRQALFTMTTKIQFEQAVNPMCAFVVPNESLPECT